MRFFSSERIPKQPVHPFIKSMQQIFWAFPTAFAETQSRPTPRNQGSFPKDVKASSVSYELFVNARNAVVSTTPMSIPSFLAYSWTTKLIKPCSAPVFSWVNWRAGFPMHFIFRLARQVSRNNTAAGWREFKAKYCPNVPNGLEGIIKGGILSFGEIPIAYIPEFIRLTVQANPNLSAFSVVRSELSNGFFRGIYGLHRGGSLFAFRNWVTLGPALTGHSYVRNFYLQGRDGEMLTIPQEAVANLGGSAIGALTSTSLEVLRTAKVAGSALSGKELLRQSLRAFPARTLSVLVSMVLITYDERNKRARGAVKTPPPTPPSPGKSAASA